MEKNIFLQMGYKFIQYLYQLDVLKLLPIILVTLNRGVLQECCKKVLKTHIVKNIVNLYISYKLATWSKNLNTDFTRCNCLFGAVKVTKNVDPDKYKYSGYCIEFDSCSQFLWSDGSNRKNVIIFGVDNRSSVHIGNENKNILVLGEGPTQGLRNATVTAEAKSPIILQN